MKATSALLLVLWVAVLSSALGSDPPPYEQWGNETLAAIHQFLWLPTRHLYAEQAPEEHGVPAHPSFMWGVGVQLSALAAASAVEPQKYLAQTRDYADAIQVYWTDHDGWEGFDVLPRPNDPDGYYDDNAWLVLALAEVFEVTRDRKYLARAAATFRFVTSCEDDKLGGGLYWREKFPSSKNTCTNAPAIVGALRLFQLTAEPKYLETAKRLYAWVNSHLQDGDGLYWDNIRLDGRINRQKFSYNSALMIRANCLFHKITGEDRYLSEAQRVAQAAEQYWVRKDGAVADSGRFAHLLLEAFLAVHERDRDPHWPDLVQRTLVYVHGNLLGQNGRYPERWDQRPDGSLKESMLLNQASPARAYWVAASALKGL